MQAPHVNPPTYFAISYTWGDSQAWDSQTITIDGFSMAVTNTEQRYSS